MFSLKLRVNSSNHDEFYSVDLIKKLYKINGSQSLVSSHMVFSAPERSELGMDASSLLSLEGKNTNLLFSTEKLPHTWNGCQFAVYY